jgi:hypothetical protein
VNFKAGTLSSSRDNSDAHSDTTELSEDCFSVRPIRSRGALAECKLEDLDSTSHHVLATSSSTSSFQDEARIAPHPRTPRSDSTSPFHSHADCLNSASVRSVADCNIVNTAAAPLPSAVSGSSCYGSSSSILMSTFTSQQKDDSFIAPRAVPNFSKTLLSQEKTQSSGFSQFTDEATCCQEPFWVLASPLDANTGVVEQCGSWVDPDEYSRRLLDRAISAVDKQVFWEMLSSLCSYPSLQGDEDQEKEEESSSSDTCMTYDRDCVSDCVGDTSSVDVSSDMYSDSGARYYGSEGRGDHKKTAITAQSERLLGRLQNPTELAALLSRVECRVLWTDTAVDYVPVEVARALIHATYTHIHTHTHTHTHTPARLAPSSSSSWRSTTPRDLRYCGANAPAGHLRRHTFGSRTRTAGASDM